MDNFEEMIESALKQELQPLVHSVPPPEAAYHLLAVTAGVTATAGAAAGQGPIAALVSALTTKGAATAAALTLATGGGAAMATAATGSASPVEWGSQVRAVVTHCRTERTADERGIGHCVAPLAPPPPVVTGAASPITASPQNLNRSPNAHPSPMPSHSDQGDGRPADGASDQSGKGKDGAHAGESRPAAGSDGHPSADGHSRENTPRPEAGGGGDRRPEASPSPAGESDGRDSGGSPSPTPAAPGERPQRQGH